MASHVVQLTGLHHAHPGAGADARCGHNHIPRPWSVGRGWREVGGHTGSSVLFLLLIAVGWREGVGEWHVV